MDDFLGIESEGAGWPYHGELHTNLNARERCRYEKGLRAGSRLLEIAAAAMSAGSDNGLASAMSLFNIYLVSEYQELQGILVEAANKNNQIEHEVAAAIIPDTIEELD